MTYILRIVHYMFWLIF